MAILKAADFLKEEDERQEFPLNFLEIPDGEPTPVLIIKVNDTVRQFAEEADHRFAGGRPEFRGIGNGEKEKMVVTTSLYDPIKYCLHILDEAYVDCLDLFVDTASKKAFLNVLKSKKAVAKKLAAKLLEFFEGDDLIRTRRAEDDKKNSSER